MARRVRIPLIKDHKFKKIKGIPGPTKEEIRSIILYKSDVKPEDIVVDIGCGTGGISTEYSLRAKKVYSIDIKEEAIEACRENVSKLGNINKCELILSDGVDAIKNNIESFDIVIVGGSNGRLNEILKNVDSKINPKGRIIIPSILIDTEVEAINILKELNYTIDIVNINVSEGKILNRGIMMFAKNPIGIVSAVKN